MQQQSPFVGSEVSEFLSKARSDRWCKLANVGDPKLSFLKLFIRGVMHHSRPLKDAVAAVAEHVAGLLPSHFTFSEAHENGDQVVFLYLSLLKAFF